MVDWRDALACPFCKRTLISRDRALSCQVCGRDYSRHRGVPYLADSESVERLLATPDGTAMVRGYRRPNRFLAAVRTVISSEFFPGKGWRRAKAQALAGKGPLLVIGSGVRRYPGAIHLDLDDFNGVDVVGDAQYLPFLDESIGSVLCEVVLEHVREPERVIAETARVLKPGGRFFFIVPFLFPYHGHPGDYRRWSREGLLTDFVVFDDLETGIHGGPCSAMVNLMSEWAYVLSGMRFPKGYVAVKGLATAVLFPLKFLDALVIRFPEAHRLASTLYIAGKKP